MAMATHDPPAGDPKKRKFSKNKKKTWRKHTDIKDVEDYLEDKRLQERTGGIVAEKPNTDLFFIDKQILVPQQAANPSEKSFKCHAALIPDPNIEPARVAHNIKQKQHICAARIAKKVSGLDNFSSKEAELHRKQARKVTQNKLKGKHKIESASYDLWGGASQHEASQDAYFLEKTKGRRIKPPHGYGARPSEVSAVEAPHAGASYNPDLANYTDLKLKAHDIEVMKQRKEDQIARAFDNKFPSQALSEQTFLDEMSVGLFEDDMEDDDDAENGDGMDEAASYSHNPPVRRENKKTIAQRNKEQRQRERLQSVARLRSAKAKLQAEGRLSIKAMRRLVEAEERHRQERALHKASLQERFKRKPKRLGPNKFEPADLEVKLVEELEGSLRQLKPEGNLAEERFKSLQLRNMIEPRKRAKRVKTFRPKVFEKKGHKEVS